jgi:hypothetical protein|uniref:Uncharacterized protein n=1 Tax=Mus musculus TaxID=10090 RepID=Q3V380_MOUSE|nr:unnamed protein product [Mus musculus]
MNAGRRRGTGSGPTGTERRRLTVVPTGRVPAPRAGPELGSAPSAVSPGLRSGVVRFRDPSRWAGTGSPRVVDGVSENTLPGGRALGVEGGGPQNGEYRDLADWIGNRPKR